MWWDDVMRRLILTNHAPAFVRHRRQLGGDWMAEVKLLVSGLEPYLPYMIGTFGFLTLCAALSISIWCCLRRQPSSHKDGVPGGVVGEAGPSFSHTTPPSTLNLPPKLSTPSSPSPLTPFQQYCIISCPTPPQISPGATVQPDALIGSLGTDDLTLIRQKIDDSNLIGRQADDASPRCLSYSGDVTARRQWEDRRGADGFGRGGGGCMGEELVGLAGAKLSLGAFYSPAGLGLASPQRRSPAPAGGATPVIGCSPLNTPPLRLRAKGLLERRGSNASLVLDLGSTASESPIVGSPPRESSADEYLMSACCRLTIAELQNSLLNPTAIYNQFWEIPLNHADKLQVPGSAVKNRYRTIIPNESTRVLLTPASGWESIHPLASYINANYIRGYAGEQRAFVATQGPMENTVTDFWRMVWQERAPVIVMITKLKEQNRTKCECYLPEKLGQFDEIEVSVDSQSECDSYITRRLTLKCGGDVHSVTHFWYTAWPDHKTPDASSPQLLRLIAEVNERRHDPISRVVIGPVVVHCSAGIGRTGCFIAACIGVEQLRRENSVDILGIICSMRLDRGGMVQTNEQYEYIHQVLSLYQQELENCRGEATAEESPSDLKFRTKDVSRGEGPSERGFFS